MEPPERLTVPTCIGCGAMGRFGTCEIGCSEQKLELVRAAAHDSLEAFRSAARARRAAFVTVVEKLASRQPTGEWETAYRSLQDDARAALRRHPDPEDKIDWDEPAEPATTWWCAACGGIDAPQPCLGICVWRQVEWVSRSRYEQARERALSEREQERRLRQLLRRIASTTPRPDHWEDTWHALQISVERTLETCARATPT